jgi:hypothetical protein
MNGAILLPTIVAEEKVEIRSPFFLGKSSAIVAFATGTNIAVAKPWKKRTNISCHHELINKYRKGAKANTKLDIKSNFLLPIWSESEPAGKLINIPGIVDAAAIKPVQDSGVPRLLANKLRTGFFDIVELKMANIPKVQKIRNILSPPSDRLVFMAGHPNPYSLYYFYFN